MENISNNNSEISKKKIKLDFKDSKYATGRRKKSIARVWVKKGSGNIHVNGIKMIDEIPRDGAHGKMIAFVHPKSTGGVLVELAQTRQ